MLLLLSLGFSIAWTVAHNAVFVAAALSPMFSGFGSGVPFGSLTLAHGRLHRDATAVGDGRVPASELASYFLCVPPVPVLSRVRMADRCINRIFGAVD